MQDWRALEEIEDREDRLALWRVLIGIVAFYAIAGCVAVLAG